MKIGLETESYHLQFITGKMDVFGFIRKTAELGLDGVMLNIIPWPGKEEICVLESHENSYLDKVRQEIDKYNLFAEIDTCGVEPDHLKEVIRVAHRLGADVIRTYVCMGEFDENLIKEAPAKIKQVVDELKKFRIKLAVENHEEETSDEIVNIIKEVGSIWVGAHCDVGNCMAAWEDPSRAITNLGPYIYTTHFKDHSVLMIDGDPAICGLPIGEGNIDIDECFKLLVEKSSLTRINIEMCYPYVSKFKREPGTGGVFELGQGAFKVEKPPFDENVIKPLDYYYPPDNLIEELIEKQAHGVETSVKNVLMLREKYCR